MAGKVKFDRDATFKQIIGADREPEAESQETPAAKEKKQDRVQRIVTEYFRYFVANGRNIGHISDFFWVAGTSGNGGQI